MNIQVKTSSDIKPYELDISMYQNEEMAFEVAMTVNGGGTGSYTLELIP